MWWKKERIDSKEYSELNKRLTKLESDLEEFDVKLLSIQQSFKFMRRNIRYKIEDTDAKDINNSVLLPE